MADRVHDQRTDEWYVFLPEANRWAKEDKVSGEPGAFVSGAVVKAALALAQQPQPQTQPAPAPQPVQAAPEPAPAPEPTPPTAPKLSPAPKAEPKTQAAKPLRKPHWIALAAAAVAVFVFGGYVAIKLFAPKEQQQVATLTKQDLDAAFNGFKVDVTKKIDEVAGRVSGLETRFNDQLTGVVNQVNQLEQAHTALKKAFEAQGKPAVEKQPPVAGAQSQPAPANTAPSRERLVKDASIVCKMVGVEFKTPFEKMGDQELAAARQQCVDTQAKQTQRPGRSAGTAEEGLAGACPPGFVPVVDRNQRTTACTLTDDDSPLLRALRELQ